MKIIQAIKTTWSQKWKRRGIIIAGIIILLWGIPFLSDGPYRGRVVDEATGQPIEGVMVVGYWTDQTISPAGGSTICLDARDTATDANGEFEIPGRRSALLKGLGTMNIEIYKVGYARLVSGPWQSLKIDRLLKEKVRWEGDRVVIPMTPIPNSKLRTTIGSPPLINCGPRNGKPLKEYAKAREEFKKAIGIK